MSIVERYRKVRVPALSGLEQVRARLEAAERRRVAQTAQQVAAGQLLLHDPEVRLAMGREQEAEAYERLNELEVSIGLPPTPYVDVPKQEFAKQIHAGQVTVAERALPAGEGETLLDNLAEATMARFGTARVARYTVDLRNQQTLAKAAMRQAQGEPEAEAAEPPMGARQWVRSLIEPYAPAAVEETVPATGAKAGPLAGYQWREPATPGGPGTGAPPSTETPGRPTAPPAPEQAQQPEGPVSSATPQQLPEPMTATEPAAPAVPPTASGPSISVPPRPRKISGRRGQSRGPHLPDAETLAIFQEACRQYNVPLDLALAVGYQESRLNPETPPSGAGAIGIMQLMPKTAAGLGVDPNDKRQNIFGGVRLLASHLARYGSVDYALVAYNAGPGRVKRAEEDWNKLPRETRNYVPSVKHWREQYAVMLAPKPRPRTGGPDGT